MGYIEYNVNISSRNIVTCGICGICIGKFGIMVIGSVLNGNITLNLKNYYLTIVFNRRFPLIYTNMQFTGYHFYIGKHNKLFKTKSLHKYSV